MGFLSVALCLFTLTVVAFAAFVLYLAFESRTDPSEGFLSVVQRVFSSGPAFTEAMYAEVPDVSMVELDGYGMSGYTGVPLEDADDTEYLKFFDSDGVRNSVGILPANAPPVKPVALGS